MFMLCYGAKESVVLNEQWNKAYDTPESGESTFPHGSLMDSSVKSLLNKRTMNDDLVPELTEWSSVCHYVNCITAPSNNPVAVSVS